MKAMLLHQQAPIQTHPLSLTDVPIPTPDDNEVLIKVLACGVCHTDLHVVEGDITAAKLPLIPGHQVVGEVVAVGTGVNPALSGSRAGVAWLYHACGICRFCRSERENLCNQPQFTGWQVDGGYAEFMVAPADFIYPIPDALTDAVCIAPLLCGGIIGLRALHQAETQPGGWLGLYGFGSSAHIALQIAHYWGCRCAVFSRSAHHQELARKLGADWTGSAADSPPAKLNSAIIFAPAGELVPLALEALDKGGVLALAGIYMTDIPPLQYDLHLYQEKELRSVTNATRADGFELLQLAAKIPIKTEVERYPLAEANQVLTRLKEGKVQGSAVLLPIV